MIQTTSALSVVAMEAAERLVQQATQNPPIGIGVSLDNSKIVGDMMDGAGMNGLRLTVFRDAPPNFWMMYNNQELVISDG